MPFLPPNQQRQSTEGAAFHWTDGRNGNKGKNVDGIWSGWGLNLLF